MTAPVQTSAQLVTDSRLKAFRLCKRKHFYAYELGRRPIVDAEALRFGSLWHAGLEGWWSWWRDIKPPEGPGAVETALAAIRRYAEGLPDDAGVDEWDLARAEALLLGYHERWALAMWDWEVLAVEERFEAPLVNPVSGQPSRTFRLGGKIDALARHRETSEVWLVEHKTAGGDISPASDYWPRLRIDGQVSMYYVGAEALGHRVAGCLYDVVRKPQLRPLLATPESERKMTQGKKCKVCKGAGTDAGTNLSPCDECRGSGWAEAPRLYANQRAEDETLDEYKARLQADIAADPNAYFQRAELVRLETDLEEHRRDVWITARHLRDCQLAEAWPRNPDACTQFNRRCPYFDTCTGAASIEDDGLYRNTVQHEELAR